GARGPRSSTGPRGPLQRGAARLGPRRGRAARCSRDRSAPRRAALRAALGPWPAPGAPGGPHRRRPRGSRGAARHRPRRARPPAPGGPPGGHPAPRERGGVSAGSRPERGALVALASLPAMGPRRLLALLAGRTPQAAWALATGGDAAALARTV